MSHILCKFAPSCLLFIQLIHQLLYWGGVCHLPFFSTSKDSMRSFISEREMERAGRRGVWGEEEWAGLRPERGVWSGIKLGTVGFLLLSCFEALCPGILHPSTLFYLFLSPPSTHAPSREGLFLDRLQTGLQHQSFGSSVEARDHADVFGADVGCPPGNR